MKTTTLIRTGMFAAVSAACVVGAPFLATAPAQAATVTSNFTVTIDSGLLVNSGAITGETSTGSVTWDDSFLDASGNGVLSPTDRAGNFNGLLDFQLSLFGQNFNALGDTDFPVFPQLGVFGSLPQSLNYVSEVLSARFSFLPDPGRTVTVSFDIDSDGSLDEIGRGTYSFAEVTAVPTPALLPGLVGLGVAAWRKRKATATQD